MRSTSIPLMIAVLGSVLPRVQAELSYQERTRTAPAHAATGTRRCLTETLSVKPQVIPQTVRSWSSYNSRTVSWHANLLVEWMNLFSRMAHFLSALAPVRLKHNTSKQTARAAIRLVQPASFRTTPAGQILSACLLVNSRLRSWSTAPMEECMTVRPPVRSRRGLLAFSWL